MKKIVKRTRTWTTKSGIQKQKTYYYEVTKSKEDGKQKFTRLVTAKKQTSIIDEKEIEKRINMIDGEGFKRSVRNQIK